MSDVIIRVDQLSKRYRLGQIGGATLREDLHSWWARRRGRLDPQLEIGQTEAAGGYGDTLWALRDVSFDVHEGEILGIIGRNGAGKSTLLKILSRVTAPTTGTVRIRGRISSLLEVGTGFHPELSGRENIYLNGAILGMKKAQIDRRLDEIVDFAEIEAFIDTPVKRYSSGMYVRLAFAVAAHLEPEILIIDEVLAVGDAAFQKKCLGKMKDASTRQGRTVLFVSHNMAAVANLCTDALLLLHGTIATRGPPRSVIQAYLDAGADSAAEVVWSNQAVAPGNDRVRLCAVRVRAGGSTTGDVTIDQACQIEVEYWNLSPGLPISASIHLLDKVGVEVLATANMHSANLIRDDWFGREFPVGLFRSVCTIPANFLNEGKYSIRVAVCSNVSTIELLTEEVVSFMAHDTGEMRKEYGGGWIGVVRPKLAWQTEMIEATPLLQ